MPRRKCSIEPNLPEDIGLIVKMPDFIKWSFELTKEGFRCSLTITHDNKLITLSNVIPWEDFVHGLTLGWQTYSQLRDNAALTRVLGSFIRECIAEGRYTPLREEEDYGE